MARKDNLEFHQRLRALVAEHEGQFGCPFVSLRVVADSLGLDKKELERHIEHERAAGRVVMNPIDERTLENLPATLLVLHFKDGDGSALPFVSLALKP